jgi:hypothetical protein
MREIAKSIFSFSWGSMVFGAKRLLGIVQNGNNGREETKSTAPQTNQDFFDRTFRAGDSFQRGMVDMMFGALTPSAMNPIWWLKQSTDTLQRSANAFRQPSGGNDPGACRSAGSSTPPCSASTGWGPVN